MHIEWYLFGAAFYAVFRITQIHQSFASAVVLVDTEVFFVALAMLLLFREKISVLGWLGISATFAGSVLIALADAGSGSNILLGDLIALGGAAAMSVYTLIGKVCRRHISTTRLYFYCLQYGSDYRTDSAVVQRDFCIWLCTSQFADCFGDGAFLYAVGAQCIQLGVEICERFFYCHSEAAGACFCLYDGNFVLWRDSGLAGYSRWRAGYFRRISVRPSGRERVCR